MKLKFFPYKIHSGHIITAFFIALFPSFILSWKNKKFIVENQIFYFILFYAALVLAYLAFKIIILPFFWKLKKRKFISRRQNAISKFSKLRGEALEIANDKLQIKNARMVAILNEGFLSWEMKGHNTTYHRSTLPTHFNFREMLDLIGQGASTENVLPHIVNELFDAQQTQQISHLLRLIDLLMACGENILKGDFYLPFKYPEIIKYMIENGYDLDRKNDKGYNALLALCNLKSDVLKRPEWLKSLNLIIKGTRNINDCNKKGRTALILAAKNNTESFVKALIVTKCDPTIKDQSGRTALRYAHKNENKKTIKLLESVGQ